MKLQSIIKKITQKFRTKTLVLAAVVAVGAGLGLSAVQAEWYPNRQPFDYNKACNPTDADIYDRCGSLTGPVFNSFINTPSYGDERAFADARRSDQPKSGTYKNVLPDVTAGSKEIVIRTYIHNNANQTTNASGKGVATGVKVKVLLPTGTAGSMRARSYISATNAALVEDTVDFTSTEKFRLQYIPGSATLYNKGPFVGGKAISDSVVTSGATIGYDALNGTLPGCFDYASVVEIRVKVIPEEKPSVELTKETKDNKKGSAWGELTTVAPGDTVNWLVGFKNNGTQDLTHVTLNDKLPPHVSVVPGTVRYIDSGQDTVLPNDQFFTTGGYDFTTWKPGANFYVRFQTTALGNFEGCEVRVRNVARQDTDQLPKSEDTADLIIKKVNCTTPVVTCTSLTAPTYSVKEGEHVFFSAKGTAQGTTITKYLFSVNGKAVSGNANTYDFVQDESGQYIVSVSVESADGQIVTSNNCVKIVDVEKEPVLICESLTAPTLSLKLGESTEFTATAKATDTTITGYDFALDNVSVQNSASNKYTFTATKLGKTTISVDVKSAEGSTTSSNCVKEIDVYEDVVVPIYRCDEFTQNKSKILVGETVTFTVRFTAKNGATFKLSTFTFGDEASDKYKFSTNINKDGVITAKHTYTKPGDYGTRVKLVFDVEGGSAIVEDTSCTGSVVVSPVKKPKTELPNTGAGSIVGIMFASTAAGTVLHRKMTLRRR